MIGCGRFIFETGRIHVNKTILENANKGVKMPLNTVLYVISTAQDV